MFSPKAAGWRLVADIGRGKDGSDRRTGSLQFATFIFVCCALVLCTFSLFHACFLTYGAAGGNCPVHASRQCGVTRFETKAGTLTVVIRAVTASGASADQQRTIKAIIYPLFKETRCTVMSVS